MTSRLLWVSAVLSGVLTVLSSAPYDQWYLAYIAFVPLFISAKRYPSITQGFAYALCCSVIAVNWWHSTIIFSSLFFIFIVVVLCAAFFLWGYLVAVCRTAATHPLVMLFVPGVIWIGIEGILSSEWFGIPCNIGISQYSQPLLIQSAALFGIYATSFLIVITNVVLVLLIEMVWNGTLRQSRQWGAIAVGITLIVANILYGSYRLGPAAKIDSPVHVAIIQPVISSDLYRNGWRSQDNRVFIRTTLQQLTARALETRPDILVWPEGGNGYFNMRIAGLRDELYQTAIRHKTDLLISSNDLDEQGRIFNSVFSISKQGRLLGRYDKVNLIPGAEDSYTAGESFHPIDTTRGPIGPVICYESNFPSPLRKVTRQGAQLLFVSTSDAPFKKTSLTINHTRTAVFRAIENNRWVIHASNTGPSMIVSPLGQVNAETGFYQRGFVHGSIGYISEMSLFTTYGYLLPMLFSAILLLVLIWRIYAGVMGYRARRHTAIPLRERPSIPQREVEERIKYWLARISCIYLPLTVFYGLFLGLIISASIVVTYRIAQPQAPVQTALQEFLEPLDSFVVDKLTQKFIQAANNTCGPAVMAYVFSYFGEEVLEGELVRQLPMTERGTSMLNLKNLALKYDFTASGVKESYTALMAEPLPVIAYINDSHYVVVNKIASDQIYLFDPALGHVRLRRADFEQAWNGYLLLVRMKPIKTAL